ncbi:MAG TPA: hypothetical protein VHF27_01475 [Acidimicrobiales bacterium]|nr:hypothetical protein [Acidimicrobiales bacterium]
MSDAVNATGSNDGGDQDDLLLADLRALGSRVDPVPAEALVSARSAIAWRTMDRELAELVDESSDARMAGARSTNAPTLLAFRSPHLTLEIEVRHTPAGRSLFGQLVPAQVADVVVRHRGGTVSAAADEAGRFAVTDALVAGPVSVRCTAGAVVVETDWFVA